MTHDAVRVRFAPSPTGLLHIGNVRTALYNWLYARHAGGRLVLRIEDTDQQRGTPEALATIFETLQWLGMDWDEGPDKGGDYGPYLQSQRLDLYVGAAEKLLSEKKAYICFCSQERLAEMRQQAEAAGRIPRYDGRCGELPPGEAARRREAGDSHVLRFRMPRDESVVVRDLVRGEVAFESKDFDDFIIVKSDGFPIYNLANVVDDAEMAISHVIRGDGLLSSTPRQLVLYEALGYAVPQFAHAPMLLTPERKKLSKRDLAESALTYRDQGYLPDAVVNFLSLLGWSSGEERELFSVAELIDAFDLERISPSPAVFDRQKMEWLNAQHLKVTPGAELAEYIRPRLVAAGLLAESETDEDYLVRTIDVMKDRSRTLNQLAEHMAFLFTEQYAYDDKAVRKRLAKPEGMPEILGQVAEALAAVDDWSADLIEKAFRDWADAQGVHHAEAIHGTRVAVSGQAVGPGLFELLQVIGRERVVARLRRTAERLVSGELGAQADVD